MSHNTKHSGKEDNQRLHPVVKGKTEKQIGNSSIAPIRKIKHMDKSARLKHKHKNRKGEKS